MTSLSSWRSACTRQWHGGSAEAVRGAVQRWASARCGVDACESCGGARGCRWGSARVCTDLCSGLQATDFRGRVILDARLPRREGRLCHRSRAYWPSCGVGAAAALTLFRTRCCASFFSTRCWTFTEPVSHPQIWASRSRAVRWCLATTVGAATQARRSTRQDRDIRRASGVYAPLVLAQPMAGRGG